MTKLCFKSKTLGHSGILYYVNYPTILIVIDEGWILIAMYWLRTIENLVMYAGITSHHIYNRLLIASNSLKAYRPYGSIALMFIYLWALVYYLVLHHWWHLVLIPPQISFVHFHGRPRSFSHLGSWISSLYVMKVLMNTRQIALLISKLYLT